jgi:hypothetical protein
MIGVATTLVAAIVLVYVVLTAKDISPGNAHGQFTNITTLLSHYIPRITMVVFIEVFAFFFLKLYKASLDQIQFYQNELTALEIQHVALEAARVAKDDKALSTVIEELVRGESGIVRREKRGASGSPNGRPSEITTLTPLLERAIKLIAEEAKASK